MNLRQKPSGIWVVDYIGDDGKRKRASTETRDKAQARVRAREIIMGLRPAAPSPPPTDASAQPAPKTSGGFTMDDLFHRCELTVWSPREAKSQKTIKSNLKILRAMIGPVLVTDMTAGRIEELSQALFAKGYAAGTVKRKIDMVGKALSLATKWEDPKNPGRPIITGKPAMPTITTRGSRERTLTDEEEAAVFETIDARIKAEPARDWRRFRALIRFLLDTAARLGEALGAEVGDFEERKIGDEIVTFVHFKRYRTKNDKPRQLPLSDAVVAELPYLKLAAVNGKVFPYKGSMPWYMWDNIRSDMAKQGMNIDDVVIHSLRHTKLTRLAKAGQPIHKISQWAGHSDIKVTWNSYAHLQPSDLLDLR